MSDKNKVKLELLDTIDRRKNERFYPKNMFVEMSKDSWKETVEVEDISHEGARLILAKPNCFAAGDKVELKLSGLNETLTGEIKSVHKDSVRVQFPHNKKLKTLLETTFQVIKLFG